MVRGASGPASLFILDGVCVCVCHVVGRWLYTCSPQSAPFKYTCMRSATTCKFEGRRRLPHCEPSVSISHQLAAQKLRHGGALGTYRRVNHQRMSEATLGLPQKVMGGGLCAAFDADQRAVLSCDRDGSAPRSWRIESKYGSDGDRNLRLNLYVLHLNIFN